MIAEPRGLDWSAFLSPPAAGDRVSERRFRGDLAPPTARSALAPLGRPLGEGLQADRGTADQLGVIPRKREPAGHTGSGLTGAWSPHHRPGRPIQEGVGWPCNPEARRHSLVGQGLSRGFLRRLPPLLCDATRLARVGSFTAW